jgi:hypothetical protein
MRPAAAIDLTKTWEIGADLVNTIHNNNSTMDDVLGYRVRGAYHFNKSHGVEVTAQFQDPGSNQQDNNITFHTHKYVLNYVVTLKSKKPDSKISAFIDLGVGKFIYDNGDQGDKSTVVQAGGGVRYFFSKSWALRFDGLLWHWHGDQVVVPRHGFFAFDLAVGVSCVFGKGGA